MQEVIAGVVAVDTAADLRHEGLTLIMEGSVNLQLSSKNTGIFDAFSNTIRVIITRIIRFELFFFIQYRFTLDHNLT